MCIHLVNFTYFAPEENWVGYTKQPNFIHHLIEMKHNMLSLSLFSLVDTVCLLKPRCFIPSSFANVDTACNFT